MNLKNIALYGKSGSGKSTVAEYLSKRYGYEHCSAGKICRRICCELFDSEDRAILNAFNDAVRNIDPMVWLRTATKSTDQDKLIVFDSMRFDADWVYFKSKGFQLWRINCEEDSRISHLVLRGQKFNPTDNLHLGEIELEARTFDVTLTNQSSKMEDLFKQVDFALDR